MTLLTFWFPEFSENDCSRQTAIITHLQSTLLSTSNPVQIMKGIRHLFRPVWLKCLQRGEGRYFFKYFSSSQYFPEIRRNVLSFIEDNPWQCQALLSRLSFFYWEGTDIKSTWISLPHNEITFKYIDSIWFAFTTRGNTSTSWLFMHCNGFYFTIVWFKPYTSLREHLGSINNNQ